MTAEEPARVLGRDGNAAVVHLPGRAYPGVHLQGDTFAALHGVLAAEGTRLPYHRGGGKV